METARATLVLLVLLSACAAPTTQGRATSTASPSAAASATAIPAWTPSPAVVSPQPSETPMESSSAALVIDGMAKIVADAVVVRDAPGRQSARVVEPCTGDGGPCPPLLLGRVGGREDVFILDGPVAADGYDWYLAASDPDALVGWIPAGDSAGPWVVPASPECPQQPIQLSDVVVSAVSRFTLLACLGDAELTLSGWYPAPPLDESNSDGCQALDDRPFCYFGGDILRPVEAPWVGDANYLEWWVDSGADLTQPDPDSWITVRGHFSDAASSECWEGLPIDVLLCRLNFIVTDIE